MTSDLVGLDRLELSTSPLSGVRSNHLSYRPQITGTPEGTFAWTFGNSPAGVSFSVEERETKAAAPALYVGTA
jgi:hypothetical protein